MSVHLTKTNGNWLQQAAPLLPATGYPATFACWFQPHTLGITACYFTLLNSTSSGMFFKGFISATNIISLAANDGLTSAVASTAITVVAGMWYFVVCRCISATNRWIAALGFDGQISHAQNTTSKAPTGMNRLRIGIDDTTSNNLFDGYVGEFWYTDTDIQPGGAQLNDNTLLQLAYNGPFSMPNIAPDILEYRSLRKAPTSDRDVATEIFSASPTTWVSVASGTNPQPDVGVHPPLPGGYIRPYMPPDRTAVFLGALAPLDVLMAQACL